MGGALSWPCPPLLDPYLEGESSACGATANDAFFAGPMLLDNHIAQHHSELSAAAGRACFFDESREHGAPARRLGLGLGLRLRLRLGLRYQYRPGLVSPSSAPKIVTDKGWYSRPLARPRTSGASPMVSSTLDRLEGYRTHALTGEADAYRCGRERSIRESRALPRQPHHAVDTD